MKKVRRALLAVSCLLRAALSQTFWRWRGLAVWGSGTEGLRRKKLQVRGERVENGMAERMGTLLSGSQDLSSQGDFGEWQGSDRQLSTDWVDRIYIRN